MWGLYKFPPSLIQLIAPINPKTKNCFLLFCLFIHAHKNILFFFWLPLSTRCTYGSSFTHSTENIMDGYVIHNNIEKGLCMFNIQNWMFISPDAMRRRWRMLLMICSWGYVCCMSQSKSNNNNNVRVSKIGGSYKHYIDSHVEMGKHKIYFIILSISLHVRHLITISGYV